MTYYPEDYSRVMKQAIRFAPDNSIRGQIIRELTNLEKEESVCPSNYLTNPSYC